MALVHYPVYNKNRAVIASALTTVDLHDLARLSATYGLSGFYVVSPVKDQMKVAEEMIEHWVRGWGATYNRNRSEALSLIRLADDIGAARADVLSRTGDEPLLIGTSAAEGPDRTAFGEMKPYLRGSRPVLLLLGTAWGLSEKTLADCDIILEPVLGRTPYNHLSVRSAAGIILDRLLEGSQATMEGKKWTP